LIPHTQSVRLDKWLWAARFFKTRSLAVDAVAGGKVHVNGARVKPARAINVGDQLLIRRGPYEWRLVVRLLETKRGPATQAVLLYEETAESKRQREQLAGELRAQASPQSRIRGRPSKKQRRDMLRFTRRES
jgi:ribosome-associated heat shock protein Hsp15